MFSSMFGKFKIMTIFVGMFLLATTAFADWTGSTREPENSKKIDGKVFYVITSAEELAWFAEQVNSGKSTINAVLANDIKFRDDTSKTSSVNWMPIGKDSSAIFNGIFDGAGRTIYGLYSKQERFAGIFGVTDSNAVIRNVSSRKASIDGGRYAGGIVAWNAGTVMGCMNSGSVSTSTYSSSSSTYFSYSGGIAGWNRGTISGCTNSGSVSYSYSHSSYSFSYSYSGGIAGWNSGTISGCTNSGSVYSYSYSTSTSSYSYYYSYSGGIAGSNRGTISGCTNSGSVSSSSTYFSYSGGIAGWNGGTVSNCKNLGRLSSKGSSGGLVGRNASKESLSNSFSVTDSARAGIIDSDSAGTVTNCYYDSDVLPGLSTVAPNSGMHTSDMQSDRFAWVLNTTDGTAAHSGVWSRDSVGYPVFADSLHLPIYKVVFDDSGATTNRYTNYKGRVSFPANPEPPEGKMFGGWYTDDGIKVKSSTVFAEDQTVHAVYIDASDIYFSIRFFDSDTTLLDSQYVQYGRTPSYAGTPTKASTAQFSYAFEGWHVEPTAVTEDFDYYAVYSETLRSYTVRFLDFDGTELQSSTYLYGATPGISKVPTRQSTVAYDYAFSGWTPAIDTVKGPATYTALYDSSKVLYTVTFMDGSSVFATVQVPYGEAAVAPGTPSREGYKFVGWNGSLSNVTGDMTVSALFEELVYREVVIDRGDEGMDTVKVEEDEWFTLPEAPEKPGHTFTGWYGPDGDYLGKAGDTVKVSADMRIEPRYEANLYRIAFVNGSDTLQSGKVAYGTLPSYTGTAPRKASSAKYTYTFAGWTPAIKAVTGDAVYTALYDSSKVLYTVAFVNGSDTLQSGKVAYGTLPSYNGTTPTKASSAKYTYTFAGWTPAIKAVTGEAVYTAIFDSTLIPQISSSSSSATSSSIGKSSSSAASGSSSSSAVKNSSSSSEPSDALVANIPSPTWSVTVSGRNFQIHAAPVGKSYALFDLQGKVLAKGRIESSEMTISAPRAGSYIVRIGNRSIRMNAK